MIAKPKPRLVVEFTKMTGAGNDFIVIDNRFFNFSGQELSDLARRLCRRKNGIGADGLLALCTPDSGEAAHFRMKYFNADGSAGSMCGNGARCIARFGRFSGMQDNPLIFESDVGYIRAEMPGIDTDDISVFLPPYRDFKPDRTPDVQGVNARSIDSIWTGTEHLVTFVDDVDEAPVESEGKLLRNDLTLSALGANVNFVQIVDDGSDGSPSHLSVRTYERGVESETLACGTGALASATCARLTGRSASDHIRVSMPGGVLTVGYSGPVSDPNHLILTGPAQIVYRGTVEY